MMGQKTPSLHLSVTVSICLFSVSLKKKDELNKKNRKVEILKNT